VRDTGSGFAALDRLQRSLGRDGDTLPGHGLGLRIAGTVAASHGGRLLLANREPHGAVVTLELGSGAVRSADEEAAAPISQDPAR
jgi:signal transduction histidine kinase